METLFALLFILISVSLAGAAFALMWKNISDISKVSNNYVESSKRITKIPHPELLEVKPGDELMVVNFKEREKEFKKNFEMVELDGGSWKIDVPRRKK